MYENNTQQYLGQLGELKRYNVPVQTGLIAFSDQTTIYGSILHQDNNESAILAFLLILTPLLMFHGKSNLRLYHTECFHSPMAILLSHC